MTITNSSVHILLCATANYIPNAMVTVQSVLDRTQSDVIFHIFYNATERVESETALIDLKSKAYEMIQKYPNAHLDMQDVSDKEKLFEGQQLAWQVSKSGWSTYFRFLPQLLLPNVDKIIYLDTDMIVNCDIQEVWNIDLTNKAIAVAQDNYTPLSEGKEFVPDLSNTGFCNAGFMIENLAYWREYDLFNKLMAFGRGKTAEEFPYADNSLINCYFLQTERVKEVKIISWEYNALPILAKNDEKLTWNGKILHYCGCINGNDLWKKEPVFMKGELFYFSPWNDRNRFYKHELWWETCRKTPFYEHFLFASFLREIDKKLEKSYPKYPKALVRLICLFIFKKEKRRKFRQKYMKK